MAAYVIAQLRVHDVETYREYALQVAGTVKPFGGRLLVANDAAHVMEGEMPYPRTVIGEFETVQIAREWYESAEYAAIRPLRQASTEGAVYIVEGMALPAAPHPERRATGAS